MIQKLIVTLLIMAACAFSGAQAAECDNKGNCISIADYYGSYFAELSPGSPAKVSGGSSPLTFGDVPRYDWPVLVTTFDAGGFSCNGSVAPSAATPGTAGGSTETTSLSCSYQNPNGDVWRVVITITWFYDANAGRWVIGEMSSKAQLIKSPGKQIQ